MPVSKLSVAVSAICICTSAWADSHDAYPTNVYWGDTHVHTYLSADAYSLGTKVTPDVAYRYARGDQVTADNGKRVRLRQPLDFLMVADHAENLGIQPGIIAGDKITLNAAGEA